MTTLKNQIRCEINEMKEDDLLPVRNLAEQLGYPITVEFLAGRFSELSLSTGQVVESF